MFCFVLFYNNNIGYILQYRSTVKPLLLVSHKITSYLLLDSLNLSICALNFVLRN